MWILVYFREVFEVIYDGYKFKCMYVLLIVFKIIEVVV